MDLPPLLYCTFINRRSPLSSIASTRQKATIFRKFCCMFEHQQLRSIFYFIHDCYTNILCGLLGAFKLRNSGSFTNNSVCIQKSQPLSLVYVPLLSIRSCHCFMADQFPVSFPIPVLAECQASFRSVTISTVLILFSISPT